MNRTRTPAVLLLLLAAGCDPTPRRPTDPPAAADAAAGGQKATDPKTTLPKPDPHQIGYDPSARVLTLYALADRDARWMLATPGNKAGEPVNTIHRFADDMSEIDLKQTAVFYTTAGGLPSPRVTLHEVLAARVARAN